MVTNTNTGNKKPSQKKPSKLEQKILDFDKKYKLVKVGSRSKVMFIDKNDVGEQVWETMEYADFRRFVMNEQVRVWNTRSLEYDDGPLVDEWLKSPHRKSYKGVTFLPSDKANPEFINLWTGFNTAPIEPPSADALKPFLVLVGDALCAGNTSYSEYLLNYLAHMFQKPYELPGVAVVMRGKQGAGKGTLMKTLAKMVGSKHYRHVSSAEKLTSRFDGYLADCILLFADESVWGGNKQAEGTLKTMITETELASEKKGQDILNLRNFKRLFAASNEEWAMPVGKEDRRFFVLDVSEKYLGNWSFWASYNDWLDKKGDGYVMHYLLNRDISKFNLRDFPHTPGHADLKLLSADDTMKFLFEFISNHAEVTLNNIKPTQVERQELFAEYMEWANKHKRQYFESTTSFSRKIAEVFQFAKENSKWATSWKNSGGKYFYKFPRRGIAMHLYSKNMGYDDASVYFFDYKEVLEEGDEAKIAKEDQEFMDKNF